MPSPSDPAENAGRAKGGVPKDIAAGILLIALAALAYFGGKGLTFFQPQGVGSGLVPLATAAIVAGFGALLLIGGLLGWSSDMLDRWAIREAFFVLGAVAFFAWTIRPLGLLVAGPLTVLIASLADRDTKLVESIIFAAVMTLFCIGLFSFALRLPIPVMPTGLPVPFNMLLGR